MNGAERIVGILSIGVWSALALVGCSADVAPTHAEAPSSARIEESQEPVDSATLGTGFVVWESNRQGAWRLWRRDLGSSDQPYALTPAEPSKAHCCAHIAPDGESLVYLSLPVEQASYPATGAVGELRRLELAAPRESTHGEAIPSEATSPKLGSVLAERARTYFEHRAAVWRGSEQLIWIDGEGRTVLGELNSQAAPRVLIANSSDRHGSDSHGSHSHGWLMDATLSFATNGKPTFSSYDDQTRQVSERASLGGCQPYFSPDGRLGVWVAGAGGPIRAIDLESRHQWPILNKGDERLPADRRYLYFPMPSNDGRALAWAASNDEHDHNQADYDTFVAVTDPKTLELIGPPIRISRHPSTDRFPAVWLEPLELGHHTGEAPFSVRLEVQSTDTADYDIADHDTADQDVAGDWSWSLGDGRTASGTVIETTWQQPGRFDVVARGPGELEQRARVRVQAAAAPQLLEAELRSGGSELRLRFDEKVRVEEAEVSVEGVEVVSRHLEPEGNLWRLQLSAPLKRPTRVTVRSVRDRAARPNELEEAVVRVEPPRWPMARQDAVFLWQTAGHANRVTVAGAAQTTLLEPKGRAFTDRYGRMVLRGGAFQADSATGKRLYEGVKASNELSLELTFIADSSAGDARPGVLFGIAAGSRRNLVLSQEGQRLKLGLRTPSTGPRADRPVVELGAVQAGTRQHLIVSYTPGRLRAFLDGIETVDTDALEGGFFHWKPTWIRLGAEGPPGADASQIPSPWQGVLEGVAVYNRALDAGAASEHFQRYRELITRRDEVETRQVTVRRLRRSPTPSLAEIAPYREALAVFEYAVFEKAAFENAVFGDQAQAGPAATETIRVVHRVLLDGRETPIASRAGAEPLTLHLEPFNAQPQLESLFLSDRLGDAGESSHGALYWSDRLEP